MVIGLEVHAQLKTKSKLFSDSATLFGAKPNSQTSYLDAGFPGTLPVLNKEAVVMAVKFGLAIQADIQEISVFERKNYFYPDLPKGYQISQLQKPIISSGVLSIELADGSSKKICIERAHLEEDAGKSIHGHFEGSTAIDLNRAGTPLLEIVTTPCLYSVEEVLVYIKSLKQLVQFLGICDGNMQEGSFRCDVNVSIKPRGSSTLGTRVELKNLNSFRFIEKAIAFEVARQQSVLEDGKPMIQETRLFNPDTNRTHSMREKEQANDYRYFPDPDLLPVKVTRYEIVEIKNKMPLLPAQIIDKLQQISELNFDDIQFITSDPDIYHFYTEIQKHTQALEKQIVNWLKGPYSAALNETGLNFNVDNQKISAANLGLLLNKINAKEINNNQAKILFSKLWSSTSTLEDLIQKEGFSQLIDENTLISKIEHIIIKYPEQAAELKAGKAKLLGFFVGLIMKETQGRANPEFVKEVLQRLLEKV